MTKFVVVCFCMCLFNNNHFSHFSAPITAHVLCNLFMCKCNAKCNASHSSKITVGKHLVKLNSSLRNWPTDGQWAQNWHTSSKHFVHSSVFHSCIHSIAQSQWIKVVWPLWGEADNMGVKWWLVRPLCRGYGESLWMPGTCHKHGISMMLWVMLALEAQKA